MAETVRQIISIDAVDNTTRGYRSAKRSMTKFERAAKRVETSLLGFVGIRLFANIIRGLTRMSDEAVELTAKLKLVTDSTQDYEKAQASLLKTSLDTGGSFTANITLFTRMNRSITAMGETSDTTLGIVRLMSQGLRISGATTQEAASTVRQFSQAMASGVLRGEEFNSITENGSRVALALADGLGVSIGKLREMSSEGKLTAQVVVEALKSQYAIIEAENAKLPLTIGRALQNVKTKFTTFLQEMSEVNGAVADTIDLISENFEGLIATIGLLAGLGFLKFVSLSINARRQLYLEMKKESTLKTAMHEKAMFEDSARQKAETARTRIEVANLKATQVALVQKSSVARAANAAEAMSYETLSASQARQTAHAASMKVINTELARTTINLNAATAKLTAATAVDTKAKLANLRVTTLLTAAHDKLSASVIGAAKSTKTMATTGAGLGAVFGKVTGFIGRLGAAALGIPGIIALVGYGLVREFGDIDAATAALGFAFKKLWLIISNPIDFTFQTESYKAQLKELQDATDLAIDKRLLSDIEFAQTSKATLADLNKARVESVRKEVSISLKVKETEKEIAEKRTANFERFKEELDAQSTALKDSSTDQINALNTLMETEVRALTVKFGNQDDYTRNVEQLARDLADNVLAINVDRINAEISNNKSFFKEQLRLAKGNKKATLDIQIKRNETLKRLNREMVNVLRDSISQAVDAAKTISDEVLTSQDRIKNATIERAELEQTILNEGLTSYQANANARNAIDEARKALKDAETLDAVTDAEQIRIIQDAQKEKLIEIFEAEKERASTFEKDTIERVEAEQNVKVAAQATKDLLDDIVDTESNLIQLNKAKLSEQEELIETRRISLQAYESAIVEIDKQLAEQRQIVIDVDATKAHSELDILEKRLATLTKGAKAAKLELKTLDDKIKDSDTSKADDDLLQPLFKDDETADEPAIILSDTKLPDEAITRQSGGFIPMRNKVGGSGEGDKIKALLEPGEFIIRKDVVKRLGEKAMYALNSGVNIMQQPIRRQFGGYVQDPDRVSSRMQSRYNNYINDLSDISDRYYGAIDRGSYSAASMASESNHAELKIPIIQDMIDSVTSANGKDYSTMKTVEAINNKIYSFISSPDFKPNDPVSESLIDNYRSARDSAITNGLDYVEPEEVTSDSGLDLISSIGGTDDTDDTGVKDAIEDINKKIYDTLGFSGSKANNPTSQDLLNKLRAIKNNILENGVSGGWSLSEAINDMMANTTAPISTATSSTNSPSATNDTTGQASRVTITFVANGASASGSFDATPNTYALLDEIRTAGAAT